MNPRKNRPEASLVVLLLAAVGNLSCKREPEPRGREEAPLATPSRSAEKGNLPPDALLGAPKGEAPVREVPQMTWTDPPGWTHAMSPTPMRLATYRIPHVAGDTEDGEMTVFHFGAGQGGGVDANFDRWVGQFRGVDRSKALRSERTAQGMNEHVLEIESGAFVSAARPGEPEIPKANYGLLGAIVDTPGGAYFFKLTGPKKTIKAARPAFFGLLESVKQP